MTNVELAALFGELADIMEIAGENPFKIRAYRNVSGVLGRMRHPVEGMSREKIEGIQGVGKAIAEKIQLALKEGTFPTLEKWRQTGFSSLRPLLSIEGITIRELRAMMKELNVASGEDLRKAFSDGRWDSFKGKNDDIKKAITARFGE